ncbi:hypothetical protein E1292_30100 [Nonomuraea deserti]|uniref:Oligopeptide/dipeptide ABC transporter C-terminal domain-containing protein n=1 Tax=Nonomuraea deserti TaxID=1848322 RepID=A0A4R4VBX5_9ACTN|nr:hypothetical protein E1292_30100 [Nonomuraea deserti]
MVFAGPRHPYTEALASAVPAVSPSDRPRRVVPQSPRSPRPPASPAATWRPDPRRAPRYRFTGPIHLGFTAPP